MKRRDALAGLALIASAAWPSSARPQQSVPVIGFLTLEASWTPASRDFISTLRTLGYEDGRTIVVETRFLAGREDALDPAVEGLVAAGVKMFVVEGRAAASAALRASKPIPVVAAPVGDARDFGITDLSRPVGRLTGITMQQDDTDAKVGSLLKELVPGITRLAVLRRVGGQTDPLLEEATRKGLNPIVFELGKPFDIKRTFSGIEAQADSLVIVHTSAFVPIIGDIAAACLRARIPAASSWSAYSRAGLLMTFSVDAKALARRAAVYVDRLLKGASVVSLPIEQPTTFNLVVNITTARALSITVPPSLLTRADEVIE